MKNSMDDIKEKSIIIDENNINQEDDSEIVNSVIVLDDDLNKTKKNFANPNLLKNASLLLQSADFTKDNNNSLLKSNWFDKSLPYDPLFFNMVSLEATKRVKVEQTLKIDLTKRKDKVLILGVMENDYIISKYRVDQNGLTIGKNKKTDKLQIISDHVSNNHCEITFDTTLKKFFIQDLGSTNGTFMKYEKLQEYENSNFIIEIGDTVLQIKAARKNNEDFYTVILEKISGNIWKDSNKMNEIFKIKKNERIILKRYNKNKEENPNYLAMIYIPDKHLSSNHLEIGVNSQMKFYSKDLGSSNGSWVRLSREKEKSNKVKLENGNILRIGPFDTGELFTIIE